MSLKRKMCQEKCGGRCISSPKIMQFDCKRVDEKEERKARRRRKRKKSVRKEKDDEFNLEMTMNACFDWALAKGSRSVDCVPFYLIEGHLKNNGYEIKTVTHCYDVLSVFMKRSVWYHNRFKCIPVGEKPQFAIDLCKKIEELNMILVDEAG